jgi:hypothetical protein
MDSIITAVEALKKDAPKVDKNKSACRRSRVNSMKLVKILKEYRVELLAKSKK